MSWETPKTDWDTNPVNPTATDFNRIEGNIEFLNTDIETKKGAIVDAINTMGRSVTIANTHAELAAAIKDISDDANAVVSDVLAGKTFYQGGVKKIGTIPSKGTATITPGTINQFISAGQYLSGAQTILGDADLLSENIKKDVNIFGKIGSYLGPGIKRIRYFRHDAIIGNIALSPTCDVDNSFLIMFAQNAYSTEASSVLSLIANAIVPTAGRAQGMSIWLVEFNPGVIKSIQTREITLSTESSGKSTINSVDMEKAIVLPMSVGYTSSATRLIWGCLESSTSLVHYRQATGGNVIAKLCVVEFY